MNSVEHNANRITHLVDGFPGELALVRVQAQALLDGLAPPCLVSEKFVCGLILHTALHAPDPEG